MRAVVILCSFGSLALAEAPNGRYRLDGAGWRSAYSNRASHKRLPSCGARAVDFITNFGEVRIEAARDIRVNGSVWTLTGRLKESVTVHRDDLLEGLVVSVGFERDGEVATGELMVLRFGPENTVLCADVLGLAGKYSR
jgi:hypothetical protein